MRIVRKLGRVMLYFSAALGLLMLLVTFTPITAWYARFLADDWQDAKGDVLIVLAGGKIDNEALALNSYWRSIYADRAWKEGGFKEIVVSGRDVAPLMRDYLICHGVPPDAIRVENDSNSTRENALYVERLLKSTPGRKVLVTSDYHMFRARRCFNKAGMDVGLRPFPDVLKSYNNRWARWPAFLTLCGETVKIVYYWARGWI